MDQFSRRFFRCVLISTAVTTFAFHSRGAVPSITTQPQSTNVLAGLNVNISVTATGSGNLTYRWRKNEIDVLDDLRTGGAATATLNITNVNTTDAGDYTVVVANNQGSVTSSVAILTIFSPPVFTQQPQSQTDAVGGNFLLTTVVTGTAPISFQWFFNGTTLVNDAHVNGVSTANLSISNAQSSDIGAYNLVASNAYGMATSAVASITLLFPPIISSIADQATAPETTLGPLLFQISDQETPASELIVTATSSNTNLVPQGNIIFGGNGSSRAVTVTPSPGQRGTNLIVIKVTDQDGFTNTTAFAVIVQPFLRIGDLSVGTTGRIYPADYNNDGLMDFLVGNVLYRNLSGGIFTNDATGLPASTSGRAAWADYDNDGDLDLAFADLSALYRNDGANHFTSVTNAIQGYQFSQFPSISWGDYNGDGLQDLLIRGWNNSILYRNKGDGTFTNSQVVLQAGQLGSAAWGDLDNDGNLDLVLTGDVTGAGKYFTYLYRNNGAGNLSLAATNLVGVRFNSVSLGDYDADGDLDILLAGEGGVSGPVYRIYRNNGGMAFVDSGAILPAASGATALWGDYDNDGDLDILFAGAGATTVHLNNGNNTFTDLQAGLPPVSLNATAWLDFDNDGDLDVVADKIFKNLSGISNTSPTPPSGLSAAFSSNRVVLSWSAAVDDSTNPNSLTYALCLGTTAGGIEIVAPDSNITNGSRRLTPEGNVYLSRQRILQGLPEGTYYWSVQAIDGGFAGSPFAPEASFSYFHPTISGLSNLLIYPTIPFASLPFLVGDADSSLDSLFLSAISSNTNLLASTNILFSGSGSNRVATFNLAPGAVGTSVVSVVVADITGLTATNTFTVASRYFTDVTPVFSGSNLFNPKWSDFDNDDDLDLYLGGTIYRNDSNLVFTAVTTVQQGGRKGMAWGDYDRDGDLDLLSTGAGPGKIYRNDGNGVFTDINAGLQSAFCSATAWGDYDNDGRLDVLLTGATSSNCDGLSTALYRNNGNDQFALVTGTGLPAIRNSSVAWGDYDNDGDLDVLLNGLGGGPLTWFAEIYRNNGNGTFTGIGAGFTGGADGAVDFGDYDNDGFLDVLVTGFNLGTYVLHVYHNNGSGSFTETSILQGIQYGDTAWADFDSDGYLDILVDGCVINYCDASVARIYRNNRQGSFNDANVGLNIPAHTAYPIAWADFNGDGALDLFMDRLYRNDSPVSNSPPTAPTGLTVALLNDNNVLLRWTQSSDAQTTNSAGLNYAVRVGTTPGGTDYISPNANAATGFRRLPAHGPANTNSFFLRDVPGGTYYWSVQAIDTGFAGSTFAVEGSFTITNTRPLISAISNQLTVPNRATPPISFIISDVETPAANLILNGSSTNTALVPNGNIVFGGSGSNRTVTVTPASGLSGTAKIFVGVMDGGGLVTTSSFDLVVQTFTELAVGLPDVANVGASTWADYDNDGDFDIALAGGVPTTIYRNSNGLFTDQNFNFPSPTANDLMWADYDSDGDLDLTGTGWLNSGYTATTFLFRNNFITNSFTSLTIGGIRNIADGSISWADYDNDGDLDLLLTGDTNTYHSPDASSALYRNDRGVFTNSGVLFPAIVRSATAWGDYDSDGDLDLLMAGQTDYIATNAIAKLFRNDSNEVFTEVPAALPGVTDCALAWGDFDNDGDLDILMAGTGTNAVRLARIYRNIGNNMFTNLNVNLPGVSLGAVAWGDYNNDGFLDALINGLTNSFSSVAITRVFRNNAGASFSDLGGSFPGALAHNTPWADFDNDGDLDLRIGTRILRNNLNIPNTPPAPPTNLSHSFTTNNEIRFAWSRASDAETTNASGLRYNLRIGTNSGGGQIVPPHSADLGGYHRVPDFGNAGPTNFWRIANLTNGSYYWSVQAIDGAFVGSAFAQEQTFVLSRPVFSAITNRSSLPNTLITPINFTVSDAETAGSNLVLTANSSDTNLLPNANLGFIGTGTNRALTVTPVSNRSGKVTITLTAVDENGEFASRSFLLTIERFAPVAATISPQVGQMAWGDYDNDGNLDFALGSSIYRNTGADTFTNLPTPNFPTPFNAYCAWGDYDNDADLDLMFGNRVYRNDGNGSFAAIATLGASAIGIPAWGDYGNDGKLDLLYPYANGTYLYRYTGTNTFTNFNANLPYLGLGSVAWADFDKDGDLDILVGGNNLLRIYRNNGNGFFSDLGLGLPGLYGASVAWADFDNDGFLDFIAAGSTNNALSGVVTRIYRSVFNLSTGTRVFTNLYPIASEGPIGVWKAAVAPGDFDNDGDLDLLVSGETVSGAPITKIYRNDGSNFVDSGHPLPALENSYAAWGDFNNDSHLDLALSGNDISAAAFSRVYRNYGNTTNIPPTAPTGLSVLITGKSARMTWNAATDPNQTNSLTYNLRVGSAPGAGDIFSPMSAANGFRRLPAFGNTGHRLTWTITNFTGGIFYWSVQAVDAAFAASAFAAEQNFIITAPPVITSQPLNQTVNMGSNVQFVVGAGGLGPFTFQWWKNLTNVVGGNSSNLIINTASRANRGVYFCTVSNDYGAVTSSNALLNVLVPQKFGIPAIAPDGSILLTAGDADGALLVPSDLTNFVLQVSDDLTNWAALSNALSITNGMLWFQDEDQTNHSARFYRIVEP